MNETKEKIHAFLSEKFFLKPYPTELLPSGFLDLQKKNMMTSYINDTYKLQLSDISFEIFKIEKNLNSESYFSLNLGFQPISTKSCPNTETLLIFLSNNTPYYWTNSGLLFLEISKFLGVSENDIQQNSTRYLEYQANLIHLNEYYKHL